ncbi:MAG TPA: hypothetical protein VE826_05930 [Dongiaceae bacterium]|nr:hypothetical protein [Dongiaceae bacterium]
MKAHLAVPFALALCALAAASVRAQSPAPRATPAAKLEDSIRALGIGLQLPAGWRVTGGTFEAGIKALIVAPESREGEIVVLRSEPAKGRTLQAFSGTPDFPPGGHAIRICNGTQDGWYADYADDRGATDAERYTGFAVIAVDARNAVAAAYSHRRSQPETADVRTALLNLCLR